MESQTLVVEIDYGETGKVEVEVWGGVKGCKRLTRKGKALYHKVRVWEKNINLGRGEFEDRNKITKGNKIKIWITDEVA